MDVAAFPWNTKRRARDLLPDLKNLLSIVGSVGVPSPTSTMSSLGAQLAQAVSLNRAILVDRSKRKASESYLFTGRDADLHDLESIYALGNNGLLQLSSVDPEIGVYEAALFSDASKETDRTLLPLKDIQELDRNIAGFLSRLGPYLMEAPTSKVLEWPVRRFR